LHFQGLTDKFKDKDKRYSGSATLSYDDFMSMVIPFLVSYDWEVMFILKFP
jgi:calcium-binding protein CML